MSSIGNNEKNGENREGEDPFKDMFENMMNRVDRMMNQNMRKASFKNPNTDRNISFSFSIKPARGRVRSNQSIGEKKMLDIIEGEKEITVVIEVPESEEKEIKTDLLGNLKLRVQAPRMMKEIPLPNPVEKIEEERYSNGTLEVKLPKRD